MTRLAGMALAVAVTLPGCHETFVSHYASMDDVRRDRAIERGWVPAVLPSDASDIHEAHDLDTNETCGRFTVPPDDFDAWASEHLDRLRAGSSGLETPAPPTPQQRRPAAVCHQIPDWIRFERALLDAGEHTLDIARLKGGDPKVIGLDKSRGHVFFWRP